MITANICLQRKSGQHRTKNSPSLVGQMLKVVRNIESPSSVPNLSLSILNFNLFLLISVQYVTCKYHFRSLSGISSNTLKLYYCWECGSVGMWLSGRMFAQLWALFLTPRKKKTPCYYNFCKFLSHS